MRTSILTGTALILVVTVILYLLRDPFVRLIITVLEIPGVLIAIGLVVAGIGLLVKGVVFDWALSEDSVFLSIDGIYKKREAR